MIDINGLRCYIQTEMDCCETGDNLSLQSVDEKLKILLAIVFVYSMFHVTWITFKFNRNQLGTVSAFVMISVPWSNQRAYQVINEKLLSNEFHCRTTDHK